MVTQNEPGPPVLVTSAAGVAWVTLNRAATRNALDTDLKDGLVSALESVAADPLVRAVVLTGAGQAFCVGQDLKEHATALAVGPATAFETVGIHYSVMARLLTTMPKPVIAAVNGPAVGAGLGLALACDLRIFSRTARLATAFSAIGLTADTGLSVTLTRSVGDSRARELILLGTPFTPDEAVSWGITGTIVDPDLVTGTASELATSLAQGPTASYAESKLLLAANWGAPLRDALAAEGAAQVRLGISQDHAAAVGAFLAKATPHFAGE